MPEGIWMFAVLLFFASTAVFLAGVLVKGAIDEWRAEVD